MGLNKAELVVNDFLNKISGFEINELYNQLYSDYDEKFQRIFGYFQECFNGLFDFMNQKSKINKHYNAGESRELIGLIEEYKDLCNNLAGSEYQFQINQQYEQTIDYCESFLCVSGGSPIPEDFEKINIIEYDPIFSLSCSVIKRSNSSCLSFDIKMIGEGAFSHVYKYKDEFYNQNFALKRIKAEATEREKTRMRREFQIMKELNNPYILKVFNYDEEKESYIMEYCDYTLDEYISKNNGNPMLTFSKRKGIALQFLKGLEYIHSKNYLHRDISFKNILIQTYDQDLVVVKLSDFGLVKDPTSDFTRTDTERKGTIIDPCLDNFKNYNMLNEVYAIGFIIRFIFTGKKSLGEEDTSVDDIVKRCTNPNKSERYNNVRAIITDLSCCKE
jgi:tRNA A-37 threonylcarbamoyl transferase component Bud32